MSKCLTAFVVDVGQIVLLAVRKDTDLYAVGILVAMLLGSIVGWSNMHWRIRLRRRLAPHVPESVHLEGYGWGRKTSGTLCESDGHDGRKGQREE